MTLIAESSLTWLDIAHGQAQHPNIRRVDENIQPDYSEFEDAKELMSGLGVTLDPWQELVARDWMCKNKKTGNLAHMTCSLSVARQNGKSEIIVFVVVAGMILHGRKFLVTSHQVKTTYKIWKRILSFFDPDSPTANPAIVAMLTKKQGIRRQNGNEGIFLQNGGECEFVARAGGSGRGFTKDTLICDEAMIFPDDTFEALISTISAAPSGDPQVVYAGSPPNPENPVVGELFRRVRSTALDGVPRSCHAEWSYREGDDASDKRVWALNNPALASGRLSIEFIETSEYGKLSEEGFLRERLGYWGEAKTSAVIPATLWDGQLDEDSLIRENRAIGIDVAPDRSRATVSVAGRREDGAWHVEVVEAKAGAGWVAPYVAAMVKDNPGRYRAVVVDTIGAGATVIDELKKQRIYATTPNSNDVANASGAFYDAIIEGTLFHIGQPQLDMSVSQATKRPLMEKWAFNRRTHESDITALVSCVLALYGSQKSRVKKPSRARTATTEKKPYVFGVL